MTNSGAPPAQYIWEWGAQKQSEVISCWEDSMYFSFQATGHLAAHSELSPAPLLGAVVFGDRPAYLSVVYQVLSPTFSVHVKG